MWKVKVNVDRQPTAKFAGHVTPGFYPDFRLSILPQICKGIYLEVFFNSRNKLRNFYWECGCMQSLGTRLCVCEEKFVGPVHTDAF